MIALGVVQASYFSEFDSVKNFFDFVTSIVFTCIAAKLFSIDFKEMNDADKRRYRFLHHILAVLGSIFVFFALKSRYFA